MLRLHRRFEELVEHLRRADLHLGGAIVSTGTFIVPPALFSVEEGDVVHIEIGEIGEMTTPLVRGPEAIREATSARGN